MRIDMRCDCGGTNQRCSKCWGSGDMHDWLVDAPTDGTDDVSTSAANADAAPEAAEHEERDCVDWSPQEVKSISDGSYGFHQFREEGGFGSYPSHEPMDDESGPGPTTIHTRRRKGNWR